MKRSSRRCPSTWPQWGTHPSWSRLLGSPRLYEEIEATTTELLGCEDVLLLPTITHIHMSVLPVLAADGTVFLDGRAHKTIYDGAMVAAGHGARVVRFRHNDVAHLEELLAASHPGQARVIAMDGVNSMTGNAPDLAAFARLAAEHDGLLYVDDAHGFGVIGERSSNELCDYGTSGNSLLRHQDVSYDNVVLVAGFSKAYSSLLAFVALPTRLKDALKVLAPPYLYSGPSPVASLATTIAGLEVNRTRGDIARFAIWQRSHRVLDALERLGHRDARTRAGSRSSRSRSPTTTRSTTSAGTCSTRGSTPRWRPTRWCPKDEVGFRIQVTAANTDEEIDHLIEVLGSLRDRFQLHQGASASSQAASASA